MVFGFSFLGMRMMAISLIRGSNLLLAKKSSTVEQRSPLTMFQKAWKNLSLNPSGPGALFGLMEKRARHISCSVGMALREAFFAEDMQGIKE